MKATLGTSIVYEVRACRCKSWYCPKCCRSKGMALRQKVIRALSDWRRGMMLTLTVDPENFPGGPEAAYRWIRKKRGIGELIRYLYKQGFLHSRRYFYVLEFQKNGWPHWHVLVEASYIPHEALRTAWNKAAPPWIAADARAGLGVVQFTRSRFSSMLHAARYATKYLLKTPDVGWPDWVLDFEGIVRRFDHSRGLFAAPETEDDDEARETTPEDHDTDNEEPCSLHSLKPSRDRRGVRPLRERLADCSKDAAVFASREVVKGVTVVGREFRYLGPLNESFESLKEQCGYGNVDTLSFVVEEEWVRERLREMSPFEAYGGPRNRMASREFVRAVPQGVNRSQDYDNCQDAA